jgi:hypothetical protein
MVVLRGLKRLRVLNLSQNPVAFRAGYRAWVLANASRLEVFDNTGVSDSERGGGTPEAKVSGAVGAPSAHKDGGGPGARAGEARLTFGVPLSELLTREAAGLPQLVQECTRHVQERASSDRKVLTGEGHPSAVLALRNAFDRGGAAGQLALVECMDGRSDADITAACTVLRTFLLELPQPVVPVENFLPLLQEASAGSRAGGTRGKGRRLEAILSSMPREHWALLDHVL